VILFSTLAGVILLGVMIWGIENPSPFQIIFLILIPISILTWYWLQTKDQKDNWFDKITDTLINIDIASDLFNFVKNRL